MVDKLITPVNRQLVLPKHHSLSDWNFQPGALFCLSAINYTSEPTALHIPSGGASGVFYGWTMLKPAVDGNIPHGILITQVKPNRMMQGDFLVFMRAQANPPDVGQPAYPANCYYWALNGTNSLFYKRVNSVDTMLSTHAGSPYNSYPAWTQLLWQWSTEQVGGNSVCRLTLQKNVNGAWVTNHSYDHADNLWPATGTALVGFSIEGKAGADGFFIDDTEIYKRTT